MKRLVVLSTFFLLAHFVTAQHVIQVRGKIVDAESGSPLPYATVFVNNTTVGATADSLGNYTLRDVPANRPELIFSSVGYESHHHTVIPSSDLQVIVDVQLKPITNLLDQIVIEGKKDRQWKRYYKRFIKDFFGETPNAALCEIANPGELSFTVDENFNFKAKADRPLEIYNRALGYKIQVSLRMFSVRDKTYSAAYYSRFTELKPKDSRELSRWQIGRLKSYRGSPRHFFKSLIDGRSDKEGYRIYYDVAHILHGDEARKQVLIRVPPEVLVPQKATDPGLTDYVGLLQKGTFEVRYLYAFTPKIKRIYSDYEHPVSWITVLNESLLCSASGLARPNSNFSMSGDMSSYRIADLLPDDYDPVSNEGSLYLERRSFNGSVSGVVRDSVNGSAIEGSRVFINHTLYQTRTDSSGKFEIRNVPEGIYELIATQSEFNLSHQKVEIKQDSVARARLLLSRDDVVSLDSSDGERRLAYFKKYVLKGRTGISILNPWVFRAGNSHGSSQWNATDCIELKDARRGYIVRYYLENMNITGKGGVEFTGFDCFDTLSTKKERVMNKWERTRNKAYRGSINHFLRSLAESRVSEEGFQIYSTVDTTGIKRKVRTHPDAETVTVNAGSSMMELSIPPGTVINFENHGDTRIQTTRNIFVSVFGIVSDPDALKVEGPMKAVTVPMIPLDYQPVDDKIRNPQVWEFIRKNEP